MVFLLINKIFYSLVTVLKLTSAFCIGVLEEEKKNGQKVYFKEVLLS